jgi:hypothetical protein
MSRPVHPEPVKFKSVTWGEVESHCAAIAEDVKQRVGRIDAIIGILRGGWVPARLLSDYLGVGTVGIIEVKFYRGVGEHGERPVVTQPLTLDIRDKVVLVVDDVADTGKTLNVAVSFLTLYGPKRLYTATLYLKPWSIIRPDFYAETTDAWIIFPWDKAETVEELVEKRGKSLEEVAGIIGDGVNFVRRIYLTRKAGAGAAGGR